MSVISRRGDVRWSHSNPPSWVTRSPSLWAPTYAMYGWAWSTAIADTLMPGGPCVFHAEPIATACVAGVEASAHDATTMAKSRLETPVARRIRRSDVSLLMGEGESMPGLSRNSTLYVVGPVGSVGPESGDRIPPRTPRSDGR